MKRLTVRLPEAVAARIEAESRSRRISKSEVTLTSLVLPRETTPSVSFATIADLIGSVDGPPSDVSRRKKQYLKEMGYGRKRPRGRS